MLISIHRIFIAALLLILLPLSVFAATNYTVKPGDTLGKIAASNHLSLAQIMSFNPQIKNINLIYPAQIINLSLVTTAAKTTAAVVKKVTTPAAPSPTPTPPAGEKRFVAYTTGYGWPDNTPQGSAEISDGILHTLAGGTGTYSDPITVAVGHTISGSKDTLDYAAGTKFYLPNLEKYFIVEDTCGDGNTPQSGPCHTGYQGHPWLDLWVGGNASNQNATLDCEDAITDTHLVIQNPASTYKVVAGDVASACRNYGDTVVAK